MLTPCTLSSANAVGEASMLCLWNSVYQSLWQGGILYLLSGSADGTIIAWKIGSGKGDFNLKRMVPKFGSWEDRIQSEIFVEDVCCFHQKI
ncbi:unnamed protein product [Urochloa humidicola]